MFDLFFFFLVKIVVGSSDVVFWGVVILEKICICHIEKRVARCELTAVKSAL